MEGMLSPDVEDKLSNIEIRETFKISKVGTIGSHGLDGKLNRKTGVRIIRDG